MNRYAILSLAAMASALIATAADAAPQSTAADPRIRSVDYDPLQVVRLVGAFRTATQIVFSDGEVIEHVALGDATAWDAAAEGNILFVKPKALAPSTNLIVTSRTKTGEARHYTFEIATRSGPTTRRSPDTYFVLRFRYPQQLRADVTSALTGATQALEAKITQLKLDRGVVEGERNLAYEVQGSSAIAPSEVTDNGRFTVLRFPGQQAMPAIYVVNADGSEALVPFDVRGEFMVVHQTAQQLRLRQGREVLCIFNNAYDPRGANLGTGTASPSVDRTTTGAERP